MCALGVAYGDPVRLAAGRRWASAFSRERSLARRGDGHHDGTINVDRGAERVALYSATPHEDRVHLVGTASNVVLHREMPFRVRDTPFPGGANERPQRRLRHFGLRDSSAKGEVPVELVANDVVDDLMSGSRTNRVDTGISRRRR